MFRPKASPLCSPCGYSRSALRATLCRPAWCVVRDRYVDTRNMKYRLGESALRCNSFFSGGWCETAPVDEPPLSRYERVTVHFPPTSMTRRLAFLAALACSNASAFVVPLASRAALHMTRQAPVLRRSARRSTRTRTSNMRYVAMNRCACGVRRRPPAAGRLYSHSIGTELSC